MMTRVSLLSSTALAAAAIVLAGAPSSAASLDALEKRVKALEKAGAGRSVSRSKRTMKLTVSGHLNRMVQLVDNGVNSEFRHVTNQQSRSRVRWVGTGKLSDDISVRTLIEFGNSDAISSSQSIAGAEVNGAAFDTRHIDLQLTSKTMGKLYIGHGSDAADSIQGHTDLSGTLVALSGAGDEDLSFADENFVFGTGANIAAGTSSRVDNFNDELDGTRDDRIRYDTPSIGGFRASISHANKDVVAGAIRYAGSFSGVKVKAGFAHIHNEAGAGATVQGIAQQRNVNTGGVGILLPMGLSFQVQVGERDLDTVGRNDPTTQFYRIGYRFKASELGETRLAASYHNAEDYSANGDDLEIMSVAVVQIIEPLGAELYASYSNLDLERTGVVGIEDIDVVSIGMRVKF
ncbi:MAG: porin [Alphaproteobacteria bacterium]|nr:porin [Alphaproteobacteria bacterium]